MHVSQIGGAKLPLGMIVFGCVGPVMDWKPVQCVSLRFAFTTTGIESSTRHPMSKIHMHEGRGGGVRYVGRMQAEF